jgi:hypothetical protein
MFNFLAAISLHISPINYAANEWEKLSVPEIKATANTQAEKHKEGGATRKRSRTLLRRLQQDKFVLSRHLAEPIANLTEK